MVLPIIPIVVGTVAGIGLEKGFTSLFGGEGDVGVKKTGIGTTFHEPFSQYAPTTVDMRQVQLPDYQVAVDSPFARQDIKKTQTQEPDVTGAVTSEGVDLTMIALIAAGALVVSKVIEK